MNSQSVAMGQVVRRDSSCSRSRKISSVSLERTASQGLFDGSSGFGQAISQRRRNEYCF